MPGSGDPTSAHCLESTGCCDVVDRPVPECYRAQCFATSRALASALELDPERHSNSFQSRMGRTPWIQPFTDLVFEELAAEVCVDCWSFALRLPRIVWKQLRGSASVGAISGTASAARI